jgi:hypothetical protein
MDVAKILKLLQQEREQIEQAIFSLERLGHGRRRGRPPAWLKGIAAKAPATRRGRSPGSKNRPTAKEESGV